MLYSVEIEQKIFCRVKEQNKNYIMGSIDRNKFMLQVEDIDGYVCYRMNRQNEIYFIG